MAVLTTAKNVMAYPKRQYFEQLRSRMDIWRSSFISHWKDLAQYLMPYRQQFTVTDNNRGERRNLSIIDSTATEALNDLESGLMSGITSPALPWFKLSTSDPKLSEDRDAKEYLDEVTTIVSNVLLRSNFYNEMPNLYGDGAAFATGVLFQEEDFEKVTHFYHRPVGSYYLANNAKMQVDVFMRDFMLTVRQVIEQFATDRATGEVNLENISAAVQDLYKNGQMEEWVFITHVIEPNPEYAPHKLGSKFKKYRSCYYERGLLGTGTNMAMIPSGPDWDKWLRESGYDHFPVLVFRWKRSGEDIYGTDCPGMRALGDIKQLQMGEKRKAQAIEKWINPPLVGDSHLKQSVVTQVPGGISYVNSSAGGNDQLKPLYAVSPDIKPLSESQAEVRERINRVFHNDLIRMMLDTERKQITATEVEERQTEKEFILGPMMEQLNQGVLEPVIINTVTLAQKQGLLPPLPEVLKGQAVRIEFVSIMAQARKALGKAGIEELANFVNQQEAANPNDPSISDNIDKDEMIRQFADKVSASPLLIRSDEDKQAIRKGRAQAAQAKAQQEQMAAGAQAAKNLAGAPVDQQNALTTLGQQAQAASFAPQGA